MLNATIVTSENELLEIHRLNKENLKSNLDTETRKQEGFVSWLYPLELLKQMHKLAPSIIVKDEERITGYALTTLKESSAFHPDLKTMFQSLEPVEYKERPVCSYNFYCMGQICQDFKTLNWIPSIWMLLISQ